MYGLVGGGAKQLTQRRSFKLSGADFRKVLDKSGCYCLLLGDKNPMKFWTCRNHSPKCLFVSPTSTILDKTPMKVWTRKKHSP